ncbi:MAG: orotidine-5'-phosphate decarboxylase [Methylobacterium sp.]|nr:MAG: orotidine-5'-phosphate decarboxylase [Methylobacterium sp.]
MDLRDRVIVALDVPDVAAAEAVVAKLGNRATFYKVGYELAFAGGLDFAQRLAKSGKKVFLDLKLHDIPNTIEKGVGQIARMGMTFLTVHAYPQTLAAAANGAAGSPLGILGVSVMTSMDDGDLARAGYGMGVQDLIARRAQQIQESGCPGIVCSATDMATVRNAVGHSLTIVTPGIRPAGSALGDQKRVMTPGEAIRVGIDHMVIGRPITGAEDPAAAMQAVLDDIQSQS